jgi:cephalosporin hydroxylase
VRWIADDGAEIDGVEYWCRPVGERFTSEPGRFCLLKPRHEVERYAALVRELQPARIVEVGSYDGGSAALLHDLARPERLLTIDRRTEPTDAFADFVRRRRATASLVSAAGVDQADTDTILALVEAHFGAAPLDLVIDDASHLVGLTRTTFNALYPRLRPGGKYVIEDWSWAHTVLGNSFGWDAEVPLTVVVFELVLACAHRPRQFGELTITKNWAIVERGPEPIEGAFDLAACSAPRGRSLINPGG